MNNRIEGNYIGTDASGNECSVANGNGVQISGTFQNVVGGEADGDQNVISGNTTFNVELTNAGSTAVQGNYIGTDESGTLAIPGPPSAAGVYINQNALDTVGGTRRRTGTSSPAPTVPQSTSPSALRT